MGAKQRRKGANGEREAAARLRELGIDAARTARNGVRDGVDVQSAYLAVEVKRRKRAPAFQKWLEQAHAATAASKSNATPIVMVRGDDTPWAIVIRLDDIDRFISAITASRLAAMQGQS